jgi:hypothetical protein
LAKVYDPHQLGDADHESVGLPPEEYIVDLEVALHKAAKEGLAIATATDTMLQLDFDTEEAYDEFLNVEASRLILMFKVKRIIVTESRSGNKHVYVHLNQSLPAFARIALQAALGSDRKREFMNVIRESQMNDGKGVLLFETLSTEPVVIYAADGYQPALSAPEAQKQLMAGE